MNPALAAVAASVALRLAPTALDQLARQLEAGKQLSSLRTLVPAATFTAAVDELAAACDGVTTGEIAIALRSAAAAHALDRDRTVELVWTGPDTPRLPVRMSAQALKQVIEQARDRLIVASFAVYDVDEVANALVRAADRGVRIDLVLESVAGSGGKISFEGASQLGRATLACCSLYTWPLGRRPRIRGRPATLHAKFAVADGRCLLTTSANLTGSALERNMELGLLVVGGEAPREAVRLVDDLIAQGDLAPFAPS